MVTDGKRPVESKLVEVELIPARSTPTDDAATALRGSDVMHIPGKAANAGGVAVSGLEMSQNSFRRSMTAEKVDDALQSIMSDIHKRVAEEGRDGDRIDYVKGANVAGYRRLAEAIVAQGII